MNEIATSHYSAAWRGAVIGFGVGWVLLFIAFFPTFAICSDTTFAKLIFPFAILADPSLDDRWWLALLVALAQYPIYIGLVAFVRARKQSLLLLCILGLGVVHIVGMNGAAAREEALHNRILRQAR